MKSNKLRRQIAENKTAVINLIAFIKANIPHAAQNFEAGYFTKCSDVFRDFADKCDQITKINGEIQQSSFELEKIEVTEELPFPPVPTGSADKPKPSFAFADGGF